MIFQDCVKFASENPTCFFATADGVQPRVRALIMWFADDKGFYFQTQAAKNFYEQLKNNKKVEVCFCEPNTRKMMRVTGEVEFLDDMALKSRCLEDRPFLKGLGIEKAEDPQLVVFRIATGEAYFFPGAPEMGRIKF